jgi:hypothetical protein
MRFYRGISAIQIKLRKCTQTHRLNRISYKGILAIQIKPRKCTKAHKLDEIS